MKRNQKWAALLAAAVLTVGAAGSVGAQRWTGSAATVSGETVTNESLVADNGASVGLYDCTINGGSVEAQGSDSKGASSSFLVNGGTFNVKTVKATDRVAADNKKAEQGGQVSFSDINAAADTVIAEGLGGMVSLLDGATLNAKTITLSDLGGIYAQTYYGDSKPVITAGYVKANEGFIALYNGSVMTIGTLDAVDLGIAVDGEGSELTINSGKVSNFDSGDVGIIRADHNGIIRFMGGSQVYINGAAATETGEDLFGTPLQAANGGQVIFEKGSAAYTTADNAHVVRTVAAASEGGRITVEDGAELFVTNAVADEKTTYDFSSVITGSDAAFSSSNIYGKNRLTTLNADGTFGTTEDIGNVLPAIAAAAVFDEAYRSGSGDAFDYTNSVLGKAGKSDAVRTAALNSEAGLTGLSGAAHGMYGFSQHVSGLIDRHEADGEGIWAAYLREDKTVDGFAVGSLAADYDLSYNGFILGGDFAKTKTSRTGAAFAYADGDISSNGGVVTTKNDVKYYAGEIYHVIRSGDMTYKADIGYARGSNDISQYNLGTKVTADLHATALHAGIRAEKAIETAAGTWAPYIGLDYFHVSTDNYTDSLGFTHDLDSANIWNIPVGVQYRHETRSGSWTLSPIVEVGYLFALGDKDTEESFGYGATMSTFRSDIAENSFIGRLGLAAKKDSMSYELHYGYQKGSDVKSNRWGVQISYMF